MNAALSKGTETVCVLRHDCAEPGFEYAIDGELVTGFDPTFPPPSATDRTPTASSR